MMIVFMLIYTISLYIQWPSCVIVHNQCSNIKFVSPAYFSNNVVCPKLSDQQIDIDTKMDVSFEINATQDNLRVLYYSNYKDILTASTMWTHQSQKLMRQHVFRC
jgi:hypothetical protein